MTDLFTPEEQVEQENRYYRRKKEAIDYFKSEGFICNKITERCYGSINKTYFLNDSRQTATIWIQFNDSEHYHDTPEGVMPTGDGIITAWNIRLHTWEWEHYFTGQFAEDRHCDMIKVLKELEPVAKDFEKYKAWLKEWNKRK